MTSELLDDNRIGHEWNPPTILVADADEFTRESLTSFLVEKGHQVLPAADGEQAWSLFLEHRPRLVITDGCLPKLDGLALCMRIRQEQPTPYCFLLFLTAETDPTSMAQGFAAGADDYMTKPIDRTELTWRIYAGLRLLNLHSTLESRILQLNEAGMRLQQANETMQAGLIAAAETQRSLLPQAAPNVDNTNSSWSYQPCEHLGGDCLNVFRLNDRQLGFFIADVCGHGLPAALLAVTLHRVLTPVPGHAGLLDGHAGEKQQDLFFDPGRVLTELNRRFPVKIENGEYFTVVYGVLDTERATLSYAGAGHPHPLLTSKGKPPVRLATDGFPIGFAEDAQYETHVVSLDPGDRICAYSDGLIETLDVQGNMYGVERLVDLLKATDSESLENTVAILSDDHRRWGGGAGPGDDVSFIFLEFVSSTSRREHSDAPTELVTK